MRILHLIYDHPENPWCGGGGALRAAEINRRLAADGHHVTVVHGDFPGAHRCSCDGVGYHPVGTPTAYVPSRLSYAVRAHGMLVRFPADIVVNDVSYFAPVFAEYCTHRPVATIIHHLMGPHALRLDSAFGWFARFAEAGLLSMSSYIVTPSKAVRDDIAGRFPEKTVENIANGVPGDLYALVRAEAPFILFLGRIDIYMKGLDLLIAAFAELEGRDVRLKIAGNGKAGDIRRLKGLVAGCGAGGRVDVLGRVTEAQKRELLRTCLFLAMPSRFEGWGITAVEANAAGAPVVASSIGALKEALGNGIGAVMVPPEDASAFRRAMAMLVADGDLRRRLGRQGRTHARQWSWDTIAKEQLAFYRRVISANCERE